MKRTDTNTLTVGQGDCKFQNRLILRFDDDILLILILWGFCTVGSGLCFRRFEGNRPSYRLRP